MINQIQTNLTDLLHAEYQVQLQNYSKATTTHDWKNVSSHLLELCRNLIQTASFDSNSTVRLKNTNLRIYYSVDIFNDAHGIENNSNSQSNEAVFENDLVDQSVRHSLISKSILKSMRSDGLAVICKYNFSKRKCDFIIVVDTVTSELEDLLDLYYHLILGREPDEFGVKSNLSACTKDKEGSPFWLLGAIGRSTEANNDEYEWILNDDIGSGIESTVQNS